MRSVDFYNGTMPYLAARLLETVPFHTGEWQSKDTSQVGHMATHELEDTTLHIPVPDEPESWLKMLGSDVNAAWADEHFLERVGGEPLNPPPSHERWPWSRHNANHQEGVLHQFSHTYPERIWPRHAGEVKCHGGYTSGDPVEAVDKYGLADDGRQVCNGRSGIRFEYGDLQDVVDLLVRSPMTRQAFLPIWFPEDTGAVHKQRVPCTLGYHFMVRNGKLSCRYYMRSCDLIRHFPDDVYMAGRLMQWVCGQVNAERYGDTRATDGSPEDPPGFQAIEPGNLVMHIASLHAFTGDKHKLTEIAGRSVNGTTNA